jgi:hypothetical protein
MANPQQLELDLRIPAKIVSLGQYRRGWLAARALWGAGFKPQDNLPPATEDDDEFSFSLGWLNFCKEQTHGR